MSSSALLSPRHFAAFERQLLLEYYIQRAKNVTGVTSFLAGWSPFIFIMFPSVRKDICKWATMLTMTSAAPSLTITRYYIPHKWIVLFALWLVHSEAISQYYSPPLRWMSFNYSSPLNFLRFLLVYSPHDTIVFIRRETLSAHSARPRKIPGWIVVVRENISVNKRAYRK